MFTAHISSPILPAQLISNHTIHKYRCYNLLKMQQISSSTNLVKLSSTLAIFKNYLIYFNSLEMFTALSSRSTLHSPLF